MDMSELFPQKHEAMSQYNTRNKNQIYIPRSRLELFKKSFVPDSIKLWNLLGLETREAISMNAFRKNILPQITIPPPYFSFGKRYNSVSVNSGSAKSPDFQQPFFERCA